MTRIPETEAEFQRAVVDLAQLHGWRVAHFGAAVTTRGRHMTPARADAAGFPDLVLVRRRVLFRELKTDRGRVSPAQVAWIGYLECAGGDVAVWRPRDWDRIVATLTRGGA